MNRNRMALLGVLLLTGVARAADEPATEKIDARLLAIHRDEAKRWEIFVDAGADEEGRLRVRAGLPMDQRLPRERPERSDVRLDVRGASRGAGRGLFESRGGPSRHHA